MKVLIADSLHENAVNGLQSLGIECLVMPGLSAEELPSRLADVDILIVRSTKVGKEAIDSAQELSLVIRAGAGVNTIDINACNERGIHVSNCPGKNTDAVAELCIGLLLAADRSIVDAASDLRRGSWKKKKYGKSHGLKGRTLGVIGAGSIGRAVIQRAKSFDMKIVAWSRNLSAEKAGDLGIQRMETLAELAENSYAVTVHLAATPETRHIINGEFFNRLKEGSIFINTSRGEIVDTGALKEAIGKKGLKVGLDVFEDEPSGGDAEFPQRDFAEKITATPHIGASTSQASEAIAEEVIRIVKGFIETAKAPNCVNIQSKSPAPNNLVVRHYNRVGVLARILDELKDEGINIEEMENTIFQDGHAASCMLKLDDRPSKELIQKLRTSEDIIRISLQ